MYRLPLKLPVPFYSVNVNRCCAVPRPSASSPAHLTTLQSPFCQLVQGHTIRASSERQAKQNLSMPAQRHELQTFCDSQVWEVVDVYVDEAESARTANRPAFRTLWPRRSARQRALPR
jgi:hypothetical protein